MTDSSTPKRAKRRVAIPAVIAGGLSSLLLAFSMTPTFSTFTAAITNNTNTANTGLLVMTESDGVNTCTSSGAATTIGSSNSATCSTINKYGGTSGLNQTTTSTPLVPKATANEYVTTVTVKNSGTVPAGVFTLTPGACVSSVVGTIGGTANLCSLLNVKVEVGSGASPTTWVSAFNGTLSALNTGGAIDILTKLSASSVAAGATDSVRFTVTLPTTAATDDTYQGLQAKQALTFSFQA